MSVPRQCAGFSSKTFPNACNDQPAKVVLRMPASDILTRVRQWIPLDKEQRQLQELKNEIEGKPKKRKPFNTRVASPWYDINRPRNMVIVAGAGVLFMFWDGVVRIRKSFYYSYKLWVEKRMFLKQLDEEDRLFELQQIAAARPEKGGVK